MFGLVFPVEMETKTEIAPILVFGSSFFPVEMETETEIPPFSARFVFSGQDGNQNRNRNVFDFRFSF